MKKCERIGGLTKACKWAAEGGACVLANGCKFELWDASPSRSAGAIGDATTALIERALATQVGGGHYKDMAIQPIEFIHKNGIGFAEGCAIKYLCRWRAKNGIEDLRKARHFIDLLIEMETVK